MRVPAAVVAIMAIMALAMPAHAQAPPPCGSKAKLLAVILGPKYGEAEVMVLRSPPGDVHLYSNMVTGTWSLIGFPNSDPSMGCIIGAGNKIDLSRLPEKKRTTL